MEIGEQYRVVLGVIGADCHAVGNKILHAFLTENAINVMNLGVMVSQDEFVQAAIEHKAHARSEEHTSELQSLMRISYAVFCLKKKKNTTHNDKKNTTETSSTHP